MYTNACGEVGTKKIHEHQKLSKHLRPKTVSSIEKTSWYYITSGRESLKVFDVWICKNECTAFLADKTPVIFVFIVYCA